MDAFGNLRSAGEVCLIFLVFCAAAWSMPPDVNEAHYLAKARHFWDPGWCSGDLFLESPPAHGTFFFLFGWLTKFVSLSDAAWIGRLVTWFLLAWSWQDLCSAFHGKGRGVLMSAGLFAALSRWGHMAGEWVLGGVESKCLAYAFVIFGLAALVRGRWRLVWPLLGCATALHVLVGGWSAAVALVAWGLSPPERPRDRWMVAAMFAGCLLSLPGVVPAIQLNLHADPETVRAANRIYVFERLSHHLLFHRLPPVFVARHVGLILTGALFVCCCRWRESQRRLLRFAAGTIAVASAGACLDMATRGTPDLAASLLRYYWFRLSDVIVPVGVALTWVSLRNRVAVRWPSRGAAITGIGFVLGAANVGEHLWRTCKDPRPPAVIQGMPGGESPGTTARRFRDWLDACEWIAENTEPNAIVLTPRHQQTVKWHAERAEVANWKDIPQNAAAVVEWQARMRRIYPAETAWQGIVELGEERLLELADEYRFKYILIDRSRSRRPLRLPRLYPPDTREVTYEVYRVP